MRIKIFSCLFLLLSIAVTNFQAQSKAGELKIEPYTFESAAGQKVEAERGFLTVPENRQKPASRLIQIAFVRFKSTAAEPQPPVVYLAGGPGGSGVGAARGARFPLFMAMREIGDVIALDQRGTGMSKPNLTCPEPFAYPVDKPYSREDLLEIVRQDARACAEHFRRQGIDLNGYNTTESADDLEDLRKALGAEKISLWGISYGTHLALATVKRHDKSINRMILAGVEGLEHTVKLPGSIQRHLENLDRMVKADAGLSRQIPSFLGLVKEVLEKVERNPVTVEVEDPRSKQKQKVVITKFALQMLTAGSFGSLEAALPALYFAMSKGDFSAAGRQWLGGSSQRVSAMTFMMDCHSGISPKRRKQVSEEAQKTLLGDAMDFPFLDVCTAWGSPDLGEAFRAPVKTKVPALFISGTLDVRTPPGNAEEVRRGFPASEHLIIDGAVHSDPLFLSSPKIKDVMLEFMRGQKISTAEIRLEPLKFTPVTAPNTESSP